MNLKHLTLVLVNLAVLCPNLLAQHLWWNLEGQRDATCLYGEITVLATAPGIYYCGANWHPGEPAGGYCGIQHNGIRERRTIFSIWDTSPQLHPTTTEADPRTIFNRFGGEAGWNEVNVNATAAVRGETNVTVAFRLLDNTPQSTTFPLAQELFREFRKGPL